MAATNEMIFGVRAVLEALEAGKEIDKILVKRDIQSELSRELFAALKGRTIPVVRVPVEKLNRITRKNHQGVIAYISAVEYASTDLLVPTLYEEGKSPLLVLLRAHVTVPVSMLLSCLRTTVLRLMQML